MLKLAIPAVVAVSFFCYFLMASACVMRVITSTLRSKWNGWLFIRRVRYDHDHRWYVDTQYDLFKVYDFGHRWAHHTMHIRDARLHDPYDRMR